MLNFLKMLAGSWLASDFAQAAFPDFAAETHVVK